MSRRKKETSIPPEVKSAVLERDEHACIFCLKNTGLPNAHFISRAQFGLGIEENILTLCPECHYEYDYGNNREFMHECFKEYLQSKYKDWDKEKLVYRKERKC